MTYSKNGHQTDHFAGSQGNQGFRVELKGERSESVRENAKKDLVTVCWKKSKFRFTSAEGQCPHRAIFEDYAVPAGAPTCIALRETVSGQSFDGQKAEAYLAILLRGHIGRSYYVRKRTRVKWVLAKGKKINLNWMHGEIGRQVLPASSGFSHIQICMGLNGTKADEYVQDVWW